MNPHWNETFHLSVEDTIEIEVWDRDRFKLQNFLGSLRIHLADDDKLVLKEEVVQQFHLDHVESGILEIGVTPLTFGSMAPDEAGNSHATGGRSKRLKKGDSFRQSLRYDGEVLVETDSPAREVCHSFSALVTVTCLGDFAQGHLGHGKGLLFNYLSAQTEDKASSYASPRGDLDVHEIVL